MSAPFMRVIELSAFGGPDVLRLARRPMPVAGKGEVLLRVTASGVNRPDVLQRMGRYAPPPGASDIPGLEVAGVVESGDAEAMAGVGIRLGDRVCALVSGGGYADHCVVPAGQCLPVPSGLTDLEAASLPETAFTVWSNVFDRGQLVAGETLLVHGGTSGIGVMAVQLGKAFGATVLATAGSDEKCAACLEWGADHAINYRTRDFAQDAMEITNGVGVNVVLDMVAGSYVARNVSCLAEDGRAVIIAVQGGVKAEFDASLVMRKRLTLTGSTLRPRSVAFKSAIARVLQARVWPLYESQQLKPCVHEVFPAQEASCAHALMESGGHIGKLVLDWSAAPSF